MNDKPRVRELNRSGDSMRWIVSYGGLSKMAEVSSCQMAVAPRSVACEMEYQIKRALIYINREIARESKWQS